MADQPGELMPVRPRFVARWITGSRDRRGRRRGHVVKVRSGAQIRRTPPQCPGNVRTTGRIAIMDDEAGSQRSADSTGPLALLCFEGSDDAAAAIAKAGEFLAPGSAVVLTVGEPVRVWEPWDPVTIVSALGRLVAKEIDLDQIVADVARDKAEHGTEFARARTRPVSVAREFPLCGSPHSGNYAEAATMPRPGSGGPCRAGIVTSSVAAGSA
jgi:hypothetical protein